MGAQIKAKLFGVHEKHCGTKINIEHQPEFILPIVIHGGGGNMLWKWISSAGTVKLTMHVHYKNNLGNTCSFLGVQVLYEVHLLPKTHN